LGLDVTSTVPGVTLLKDGGTWVRWGPDGDSQVTGALPLKGITGPQPLPLPVYFLAGDVSGFVLLCAPAMEYSLFTGPKQWGQSLIN
jgi:hypothetical protein